MSELHGGAKEPDAIEMEVRESQVPWAWRYERARFDKHGSTREPGSTDMEVRKSKVQWT